MSGSTVDRLGEYLDRCCRQIVQRAEERLDREKLTRAERDERLSRLREHLRQWRAASEPAALRAAPKYGGRT